jgi:hypothetical protein
MASRDTSSSSWEPGLRATSRRHSELVDAIFSFMEPVGSKNDPLRFRRDSDKFSSVSDGKFDKDKGIIQDLDVLSNQLQCLENLCR